MKEVQRGKVTALTQLVDRGRDRCQRSLIEWDPAHDPCQLASHSGSKQGHLLLVFAPSCCSVSPSKALPKFLIWPLINFYWLRRWPHFLSEVSLTTLTMTAAHFPQQCQALLRLRLPIALVYDIPDVFTSVLLLFFPFQNSSSTKATFEVCFAYCYIPRA